MFTPNLFSEIDYPACLYGEGYGVKIQKGGNYIKDDVSFILFDIKIGNWWLKREDVEIIGHNMGVDVVPIIYTGNLVSAIALVKDSFVSTVAQNKSYIAEGLVLKPEHDLFMRNGQRIVVKIKHKDFK